MTRRCGHSPLLIRTLSNVQPSNHLPTLSLSFSRVGRALEIANRRTRRPWTAGHPTIRERLGRGPLSLNSLPALRLPHLPSRLPPRIPATRRHNRRLTRRRTRRRGPSTTITIMRCVPAAACSFPGPPPDHGTHPCRFRSSPQSFRDRKAYTTALDCWSSNSARTPGQRPSSTQQQPAAPRAAPPVDNELSAWLQAGLA